MLVAILPHLEMQIFDQVPTILEVTTIRLGWAGILFALGDGEH